MLGQTLQRPVDLRGRTEPMVAQSIENASALSGLSACFSVLVGGQLRGHLQSIMFRPDWLHECNVII